MRPVLRESKVSVTDLQHIRVRVAPEVHVVHQEGVFVGEGHDAVPRCCGMLIQLLAKGFGKRQVIDVRVISPDMRQELPVSLAQAATSAWPQLQRE